MERISRLIMSILLLIIASCGAPKNLPIVEMQKDSVTVIVRDSVIMRDSLIYIEVPVEVQKVIMEASDTSHLETSMAISEAWVSEGKLRHTLQHKDVELEKKVEIPDHYRIEEVEKVIFREIVNEVEVEKELTSWQNFRITLGTIAIICIVFWLIMNVVKKLI